MLTRTKVADAEGKLLLDRRALLTMQRDHDAAVRENEAPTGVEPGSPWPLERAMGKLAGPAISKAGTWDEVHRNLAAIGMRYVAVGNTGVLEAVSSPGPWSWSGRVPAGGVGYEGSAAGRTRAFDIAL